MGATTMLLEIDGGPVRRSRKGTRDIAIGLPERMHEIAGLAPMRNGSSGRKRRPAVRNCRQWLVVDLDQSSGVLGEIASLRNDDRHGLAHKGDFILGENERRDVQRQLGGAKLQRNTLL